MVGLTEEWAATWDRMDEIMSDGDGRSVSELQKLLGLPSDHQKWVYVQRRLNKLVRDGKYGIDHNAERSASGRMVNIYFRIDPNDIVDMEAA